MGWWAIDLWWIKISPTHLCFILMKNRKEMAFEKKKIKLWENFEKDNSLKFIYIYIVC